MDSTPERKPELREGLASKETLSRIMPASTLAPGSHLGPYEVEALIGAGGMGEVYRALDSRLRRPVAVKVLSAIDACDPERVRRFKIEALAAAALNHPNILAVYDIGCEGGTPFVVSELLEGESLRQQLTRGALSPARAIDYSSQIAAGLAVAHAKGIVHRDLKPDNVFLTADGRVKILDFGIAKLVEPSSRGLAADDVSTTTVTQPGAILGTLGYMSPEQIRGQAIDGRADIFSLGCLLYEMLSGRRAFMRDTAADMMAAALDDDPPPLTSVAAAVSSALARIVSHCLEKVPERRFQSASDLAFALSAADTALISRREADETRLTSPPTYAVIPLPVGARLAGMASPPIAISRDGTKLACVVSTDPGPSRLHVAFLDRGDTIEIPDSDGAVGPSFSPDGLWIAFAVDASGARGAELRKHSFVSHLTQTICPLGAFEGASWADDGAIYFVESPVDGLRRVPVDGGTDETVRQTFLIGTTEAVRCIGYPQFAPGARRAIVIDWDASALGDTSLLDLTTGELRSLANGGSTGCLLPTGHVLFTKADGTLLAAPIDSTSGRLLRPPVAVAKDIALDVSGGAFAVSSTGTLVFAQGQLRGSVFEHKRLVRLMPGGDVDVLPFAQDSVTSAPRISPDRHRLAVSSRIHGLWICDLIRGTRVRMPPGAARLVRFPVWTPDGERVIFRGALVGEMGWKVFSQWADGRGAPEILIGAGAREKRPCGVMPDGRLLCVIVGGAGERGLWAFPIEGGEPERLFAGQVEEAALSPDGQLVAYESEEFGSMNVFVRRLADRGIGTQVSVHGGRNPRWSNDAARLFFVAPEGLVAAPIDRARHITVGSAQVVFERAGIEGYDVDEETILAAERPPGSGEICQLQVVTNWFPQLQALAPVPAAMGSPAL